MINRANESFLSNMKVVVVISLLMMFTTATQFRWFVDANGQGKISSFSQIDVFVISNYMMMDILLILILILGVFSVKHDFFSSYLIKYKNNKKIWTYHVVKMFLLSVYSTLLCGIFSGIVGKLFLPDFNNWESDSSYLHISTGMILKDYSYIKLLFIFASSLIMIIFFMLLILTLGIWIFDNYIFAGIICVLISKIDLLGFFPISLFSNRVGLSYLILMDEYNIVNQIVIPVVGIVLVILAGYYITSKKEFLKVSKIME